MRLKKIVFLNLLVLTNFTFAQSTNDLKLKLDNYIKQDTTRCYLLNQNIEAENDQNIWIKYNEELRKIAQEKSKSETNPVLKKSYIKYLSIAFNNEGAFYVYTEEFEKAIRFYRKSLQITTKINYDYGTALALQNIATAFDYQGKLDSTLIYMKKAYFYAKRSNNKANIAYILTDLGFVNNNLGNSALAIKYNLEALPLFEKTKDLDGLERTYFALGRIFDNQKDYKTSTSYYEKCLKIDQKTNNNERLILVLNSLAATNIKQHKLDVAKQFNNQAFEIASKLNNEDFIAASYKSYGDIYFEKQSFKKANDNYTKAFEIFKKLNSDVFLSKTAIKIATSYYKLNNLDKAKEYGLLGYYLTKKTNYTSDEKDASEILSDIYSEQNDYKNAFNFKKIASDIGEKIYYDESKDIALKATYQYETEKKEAKIKELNHKKKIAELQSNKKTILINIFIISFLALAILAYFLFFRYKEKKKNELLETKLAEAQKLLEAEKKITESELKALKSQMNPHFIFNALNSIQSQFMFGNKLVANEQMSNFTNLTRQILEVSGKKQITISTETDILTNYLELEKMRFAKDFEFKISVSKNIDQDYHKIPPMLLQPFIENSIKHGLLHKKGDKKVSLNIDVSNEESFLICTIEDNGIGRTKSAEIKSKSILKYHSFSTNAIEERLKLLNNNLKINELIVYRDILNSENQVCGTIVILKIPLI